MFTRYSLRKASPLGWKWEAEYRGREVRKGYCLTKRTARWRARSWLRLRRAESRQVVAFENVPMETLVVEKVALENVAA